MCRWRVGVCRGVCVGGDSGVKGCVCVGGGSGVKGCVGVCV